MSMVISWASLLPGRGGFAVVSGRLFEPAHQRRHTDRLEPGLRDPQAVAAIVIVDRHASSASPTGTSSTNPWRAGSAAPVRAALPCAFTVFGIGRSIWSSLSAARPSSIRAVSDKCRGERLCDLVMMSSSVSSTARLQRCHHREARTLAGRWRSCGGRPLDGASICIDEAAMLGLRMKSSGTWSGSASMVSEVRCGDDQRRLHAAADAHGPPAPCLEHDERLDDFGAHRASGLPTTAASATAGWRIRQSSISPGPMR
jgi:hypothetical protein